MDTEIFFRLRLLNDEHERISVLCVNKSLICIIIIGTLKSGSFKNPEVSVFHVIVVE